MKVKIPVWITQLSTEQKHQEKKKKSKLYMESSDVVDNEIFSYEYLGLKYLKSVLVKYGQQVYQN